MSILDCQCCQAGAVRNYCRDLIKTPIGSGYREYAIVLITEAWSDDMSDDHSMRVMQACRIIDPVVTDFAMALISMIKHDMPTINNCSLRDAAIAIIRSGWNGQLVVGVSVAPTVGGGVVSEVCNVAKYN